MTITRLSGTWLLRANSGGLERYTLTLFLPRRVSASCDRGVLLTLQVGTDNIAEYLRRPRIVLVLQVASDDIAIHAGRCRVVLVLEVAGDGVVVDDGGCRVVLYSEIVTDRIADYADRPGVVLYGEIAADVIAGARGWRGRPDQHRGAVVLELHIAVHGRAANLALC